ncbi:hypothetical protein QLX08_004348 [Tetragonisca angustula]|uniref:Uncharacterized protein n=2 Tax=Tetragonisca angustula TaxID=166442 RepID=A0AAW1A346_9HYME
MFSLQILPKAMAISVNGVLQRPELQGTLDDNMLIIMCCHNVQGLEPQDLLRASLLPTRTMGTGSQNSILSDSRDVFYVRYSKVRLTVSDTMKRFIKAACTQQSELVLVIQVPGFQDLDNVPAPPQSVSKGLILVYLFHLVDSNASKIFLKDTVTLTTTTVFEDSCATMLGHKIANSSSIPEIHFLTRNSPGTLRELDKSQRSSVSFAERPGVIILGETSRCRIHITGIFGHCRSMVGSVQLVLMECIE